MAGFVTLQDKTNQLFISLLLIEVRHVFSGMFLTAGQIHFHVVYIYGIISSYKAAVYFNQAQVEVAHEMFAAQ